MRTVRVAFLSTVWATRYGSVVFRALACLVLLLTVLTGCGLENASPTKKLADSVQGFTDATRWGQLGTAANLVEPTFRRQFLENHRHWGGAVQLADSDIVHVEISTDKQNATALVAYQWYLAGDMALLYTVVRQRWTALGDGYGLVSEAVVQGDGRLFNPNSNPALAPSNEPVSLLGDSSEY